MTSSLVPLESGAMLPDYTGGSILNLVRTIADACGVNGLTQAPCDRVDASLFAGARNIVLLVIDGMGEALLRQRGAETTLRAHQQSVLSSVFPSTTASAVTTLLTGLAPAQHALTGWHMYFDEYDCVGLPLLLVRREVPPAGERRMRLDVQRLCSYPSLCARMQREAWVVSPADIVDSRFNVYHTQPARRIGYTTRDEMVERISELLRAEGPPRYIHAYDPQLDSVSHRCGAYGDKARAELALIDAAFVRLLERAAGTDTLFVVTADHGFIDSPAEHCIELEAHPVLAQMLRTPLCGEPRVAWCNVKPDCLDGFDAYVAGQLAHAARGVPSARLIDAGWFGPGKMDAKLASRCGNRALLMRDDWTIRDWLPGEKRYRQIGVHGGLSSREMQVPLILARP